MQSCDCAPVRKRSAEQLPRIHQHQISRPHRNLAGLPREHPWAMEIAHEHIRVRRLLRRTTPASMRHLIAAGRMDEQQRVHGHRRDSAREAFPALREVGDIENMTLEMASIQYSSRRCSGAPSVVHATNPGILATECSRSSQRLLYMLDRCCGAAPGKFPASGRASLPATRAEQADRAGCRRTPSGPPAPMATSPAWRARRSRQGSSG
jgi:hypothetical protein